MLGAGMDVARLNFSHGSHEDHAAVAKRVHSAARREKKTVAILQDLQGPKLRVGDLGPEGVRLERGKPFVLTTRANVAGPDGVSVSYARLPRDVKRGDRILLDELRPTGILQRLRTGSGQPGRNRHGCHWHWSFGPGPPDLVGSDRRRWSRRTD